MHSQNPNNNPKNYDALNLRAAIIIGAIAIIVAFFTIELRQMLHIDPPRPSSWLGVSFATVTDDIRNKLNIPTNVEGVLIGKITPHSPADNAELSAGDVIVSSNGQPVHSEDEFESIVRQESAGNTIRLRVWREGSFVGTTVTLGASSFSGKE